MPNEYAQAIHELDQAKVEQRAPEIFLDPGTYPWWIGGSDGTGGLRRARRITGARVEPSRGVEAEHRPPRDADTIAGDC